MMDDAKARLRDEVAALSKAVRELRDELAAERASRHGNCCGHGCLHWHYTPVPWVPYVSQPYVITCGDTTTTNAPAIGAAGAVAQGQTYLVNDSGVTSGFFNG